MKEGGGGCKPEHAYSTQKQRSLEKGVANKKIFANNVFNIKPNLRPSMPVVHRQVVWGVPVVVLG